MRRARDGNVPSWVDELGERAWSCFDELGFPTARRGNEKWKYTNVAPIARTSFTYSTASPDVALSAAKLRRRVPWKSDWLNLVFVNGRFAKALSTNQESPDGLQVTSLAEVMKSDGRIVEQHLAKYASYQDDGFTALNTAFLSDGAFVNIPEGCATSPIVNVVFVAVDRPQPSVSYPRTLIVVGSNAKATIVETFVGWGDSQYFSNAVTEIELGDGSAVDHYRLLLESPQSFHVGTTRVRQGQDSSFASTTFELGTALARYDLQVLLDAPGSSCALNGLYLTTDKQHVDNLISIDHAKPHTTSRLFYKGILDGKSKAVFGGEVLVRKDAQKANAHQTDKNLLLSAQAEVDSKPSLLIYADDVNCGHGATAGNVDPNALFYMRSRGLDLETASRMLIHAFALEIIETVKLGPLQKYLDRLFLKAIPTTALPTGGAQ